jgi:hypothetical protein
MRTFWEQKKVEMRVIEGGKEADAKGEASALDPNSN